MSSENRVILDPDTLQRRLLLCLYGLGTNAGPKRVSTGTDGIIHSELQHVWRLFDRFIHPGRFKSVITSRSLSV